SPTKTFNLAGLHVSYMVISDADKRQQIENVLATMGFRMLNTMGIVALDAAYRHGNRWLDRLLDIITENKQYVLGRIATETNEKVKALDSEGTYLLWLDFSKLNMSDVELRKFLVEEA